MHAQTCNTSQCAGNAKGPGVMLLHNHMPQQAVIRSTSKSHNKVYRTKTVGGTRYAADGAAQPSDLGVAKTPPSCMARSGVTLGPLKLQVTGSSPLRKTPLRVCLAW